MKDHFEKDAPPPAQRAAGEAIRCIPKDKLIPGRSYLGAGRGSNIAFWSGRSFWHFEIMGEEVSIHEDDGPPLGDFQPFEEIPNHRKEHECVAHEGMSPKPQEVLEFWTEQIADVGVVHLEGKLLGTLHPGVQAALERLLAKNISKVVVDLGKVDFLNSQGASVFIAYVDRFRQAGGELIMAGAAKQALIVLERLGVTSFIRNVQSVQDAIELKER